MWSISIAPSYMSLIGGVAGSQPCEYSCAHRAQINFGDITPSLTYMISVLARVMAIIKHTEHKKCLEQSKKLFIETAELKISANYGARRITNTFCLPVHLDGHKRSSHIC